MRSLPRIHAEVGEPLGSNTHPEFGEFGFYSGVTNMSVRVGHAYEEDGLEKIEALLQSPL